MENIKTMKVEQIKKLDNENCEIFWTKLANTEIEEENNAGADVEVSHSLIRKKIIFISLDRRIPIV